MSEQLEFEGKDLDEAVAAAAAALRIPVEQVQYRLVDEGRRGVFGLGARQVRIRVEADRAAIGALSEALQRPVPSPVPMEGEIEPTDEEPAEFDEPPPVESAEDQAVLAGVVQKMMTLMGLEVLVKVTPTSGGVRVEIGGRDRRMLAQRDGETVVALQFLLNRMARRSFPGAGHIQVTCDGVRSQREEDVVELAREVALQVARTGKAKRLHSMNPYERRLVHLTVREVPGVTSRSEGEGFLKQVTVEPARRGA